MNRIRRFLCRSFHRKIRLPIHGRYICCTCGMSHPAWHEPSKLEVRP